MDTPNPAPHAQDLTKQEHRIMHQVADGKCNRHIAEELCLSPHTIKKLGLCGTVELFRYALQKLKNYQNNPAQPDLENEADGVEKKAERGGGVTH